MEEGRTFYTMYASGPQGENTSMMFQRLTAAEALFGKARATLEASVEPSLKQLESMGLTNLTSEIKDVEIGGKTLPCLQIQGEISGVTLLSHSVAMIEDGYLSMINMTAFSQEGMDALYNGWHSANG